MNSELQNYARKFLKENLKKCTEGQQLLFKRMYAGGNLDLSIEAVVDCMGSEKLDWAMQQVQSTLSSKRGKK